MEEELKFLLDSDENISDGEICEYEDEDGKGGWGLALTIGPTETEINEMIKKNNGVFGDEIVYREILLTEKDLKKVLKLIKEAKQ